MAARILLTGRKLSIVLPATRGLMVKRNFYISQRILGELKDNFKAAKERLNTLKEDPGNEVKLKLYALFKQATIGRCNTPKPGAFDFIGKAKWTAWNDLGDLTQEDAQKKYVELVDELAGTDGASDANPETDDGGSSEDKSSKFKALDVFLEDGVQVIKLNRPHKYNAITWEMYEEIIQALDDAEKNKDCVVAMVTGAGDYYCSGNDLSNFTKIPPEGPAAMAKQGKEVLQRFVGAFIDFPKPLIAAVNGPAVGIPVTILGLFDIIYATDRATFHTPFMELGQSPEGCSSYVFPKVMGNAKANEVLLASKKLTATEAQSCGLVSQVFLHDDFHMEVKKRVTAMAALPPRSLQLSKQLIRDAERQTLHMVNQRECTLLEERWLSEECMQAIMKFMQRKSS